MIIDFKSTDEYGFIDRVRELIGGDDARVYIETFGCQQNEADSEKLLKLSRKMGFAKADRPEDARLIMLNTCAIREHAETKALSLLGRFKVLKANDPRVIIGVCGCMPAEERIYKRLLADFKYVDFTLEPNSLYKLPSVLYTVITESIRDLHYGEDTGDLVEGLESVRRWGHKAWLSIMYGCNNFCTYCIVPYTRGRERSRSSADVINEARRLVADGVKEITLLGQNVNSYRSDMDFPRLLEAVANIEGDFVVRFMTSHPKDVSDSLISVMKEYSPKVAPYFHLPMQSGSDRILKKMNRTYDSRGYLGVVDRLRAAIPDIAISTDVIVGFPGEEDCDFEDTMRVLREARLDSAFAFAYSPRQGTPAARLKEQIDKDIKSDRLSRLLELQDAISKEKNMSYVGKTVRVLVDGESKRKRFTALNARTYSNKLVHFEGDASLIGSFAEVEITSADSYNLIGKLK